jgi:hypothetical protein
MTDADPELRAALDRSTGAEARPAAGRFAPYPVWFAVAVLVRGSFIFFLLFCVWYLAALIDAFEKPHTIPVPPLWLWLAMGFIAANESHYSRWRTSPVGDAIGNLLAAQHCPACGQGVFDHTPPSGYVPDAQRRAWFPSRICTNCGHDLRKRTAG